MKEVMQSMMSPFSTSPYIITSPFYDCSNILATSPALELKLKSLTYRRLDIDMVADIPQILTNIPPLPRRAAVAHDRKHDGHENAADNELGFCPNHVCRRCLATCKSTTTPLHESPTPPQRHAIATHKTRHHANLLPASPVVTPPNHGAQDPATANTRASPHGRLRPDDFDTTTMKATTAGADSSKDNDDDIDNTDDMRPATTMVMNALTMSWALARGSKPRKSLPLPPHHTLTPHRPFTSPPTPPPRHGAQDSPRPHAIATCKTHHDANPPRRHPPTPRKICYNANLLPASPAVRHHASRKPCRDANVALRTLPPVTRLNGTQDHASALRNSLTVMPPLTIGMQRASPTADDEDDGSEDNSNDTDNMTPNDTDTDAGNNDTRGPRSAVAAATQWWRRSSGSGRAFPGY
ncbi:hypothetical protein EDB85DRAFT_2165112 [Lactarius pseudohatsudake]|nr:hypothetical protein EDB85DRAFT_2165112 [Lactarius pseudohatsudake]